MIEHCNRLRALQQAKGIFADIGGAVGASLQLTVARVMGNTSKRFFQEGRGDATVVAEMRASQELSIIHI